MYYQNTKTCAMLFLLVASANLQASLKKLKNEESPVLKFVKDSAGGGLAGMGEALANQPIILLKNQLQQGKSVKELGSFLMKTLRENPHKLYTGLGINLTCMVPATAMQIAVEGQLKNIIPSVEMGPTFMRNSSTGIVSALACNTSELVIINQQNEQLSAKHMIRKLYREHGAQIFMRGVVAKIGRDSIFVNGFLTGYPQTKQYLEKSMHPSLAVIAATLLVGPPTAFISHPFDTISTRMQADPSQKIMKGFLDTLLLIMKENGMKGFLPGFIPRTFRILVAIPLMTGIKNGFNDHVK